MDNKPLEFRAVVIRESLREASLPAALAGAEVHEYPHLLDESTPITIVEFPVTADAAPRVALQLAEALLPEKYYAHLVAESQMLIAFPHTVFDLRRDDEHGARQAQTIGRLFAIPDEQMRFAEMFDTDHPDAPTIAG